MRLRYLGKHTKLKTAVTKANEVLGNEDFYHRIQQCSKFDNTKLTPTQIAGTIKAFDQHVNIRTWWNPFSSANAKTGNSKTISMNTAKIKKRRKLKYIVNTLVHEYVHAVDFENGRPLDFTHVDNENDGEEDNTAPWAIGKIAEDMVGG